MPFRQDVVKDGGRATGLVVRLSDYPVKGSEDAERTANKRCAFCTDLIGLDRPFHCFTTVGGDQVHIHADCWKRNPRVL